MFRRQLLATVLVLTACGEDTPAERTVLETHAGELRPALESFARAAGELGEAASAMRDASDLRARMSASGRAASACSALAQAAPALSLALVPLTTELPSDDGIGATARYARTGLDGFSSLYQRVAPAEAASCVQMARESVGLVRSFVSGAREHAVSLPDVPAIE